MKPRWTYEIVPCRRRTKRSGVCQFYAVVRNDGKEMTAVRCPYQSIDIKKRFERWAMQPWR